VDRAGAAERDDGTTERDHEQRQHEQRLHGVGNDGGPQAAVARIQQHEAADEHCGLPLWYVGDKR
jgi:hypothetical protein